MTTLDLSRCDSFFFIGTIAHTSGNFGEGPGCVRHNRIIHLENIGVLLQHQKALPQCPLLPQYCSNTLQWALPQCCCNTAIAAALPQYSCNTVLLQYCRNGAIAAIRCAHCSNPQCLNALPQHCGNDLLPQHCSNAFGHCRLPESTRAVCSFRRAALEP